MSLKVCSEMTSRMVRGCPEAGSLYRVEGVLSHLEGGDEVGRVRGEGERVHGPRTKARRTHPQALRRPLDSALRLWARTLKPKRDLM
jgi:hypothetical protein